MKDKFFAKAKCDRCDGSLKVRSKSLFTLDTICTKCSDKEDIIRKRLREKGISGAMEGCGYIPNPDKVQPIH